MCRVVPAAILFWRAISASRAAPTSSAWGVEGCQVLIGSPEARARGAYRWAAILYDRAYRLVHGLDGATARVGPALSLEVRRSWRPLTFPDGTSIASGERIGILHLNNARIAAVHVNGQPPVAIGLEFRRWLLCSLRELAHLAAAGGPLADVRAFSAITIFHRGLARIGFCPERDGLLWPGLTAAYQRALMASLHPVGLLRFRRAPHTRARRLWLTREELLSRYT